MIYFVYFLAIVGAYYILSKSIMMYYAYRTVKFFLKYPDKLPENLPDYIQDFKETLGEEDFYRLYRDSKNERD